MKLKHLKLAPALIALCVIALVCLVRILQLDFFERLERMTYDMRVRAAARYPAPAATNLGFVYFNDNTITEVSTGLLGRAYGLYWPRHIYGRLARELAAQNAKAIAFDVLFAERRPDQSPVSVSMTQWPDAAQFVAALHPGEPLETYENDGEKLLQMESDDYFAWQLHRAGNVIVGAEYGSPPDPLFATNAAAVGDITANSDSDGVRRRVRAFTTYREWHRVLLEAQNQFGVDLQQARIEPGKIILPLPGSTNLVKIPIDAETNINLHDFLGPKLPPGLPEKAKAFADRRIWHMGIVLAARELNLDLEHADVDLPRGKITLRGPNGIQRVIPVDRDGYFYINWELPITDHRVAAQPMEVLLGQDMARNAGETNLANVWSNKLVVVGSTATGNDLTDHGATPLEHQTFLVSTHWNVANSVITGRFVRKSGLATDLLLIAFMGIVAAWLTWELRVLVASGAIAILLIAYIAISAAVYVQFRYWIPVVLPVIGGLLMNHVVLVTYRVIFEQAERRRVRSVFSKMVSPKIVNELLQTENLVLRARREITVMFSDVRGFTAFTDSGQEQVSKFVEKHKLTGAEAEKCYDEQARQTLETVNLYLALIADIIKKHDGTLDKFIGDCVMAFWGAPTPNPQHAADCVRAAIDAQRGMYELNRRRAQENQKRELENAVRIAAGQEPLPMLPLLLLGTGINTGVAIAGIMGSAAAEAESLNYTVFGREVNLASRLEGASGRGRIFISEMTLEHLRIHAPEIAATCIAHEPIKLKGFGAAVKVFEVPWRPEGASPFEEELPSKSSAGETTDPTMFMKRL